MKLSTLGNLEQKVMAQIWQHGSQTVREVKDALGVNKSAYTTIMTTMDRLYKKGLLARQKEGLAYVYRAALSESEFQKRYVEQTVSQLFSRSDSIFPVLAAFVDTAVKLDEDNLATLEALIDERKNEGK